MPLASPPDEDGPATLSACLVLARHLTIHEANPPLVPISHAGIASGHDNLACGTVADRWDSLHPPDPAGLLLQCQGLLKLGYRLADIKLAQPYARAMGLDTEAVLRQTTAGLSIEQVAANRAAEMEAAQQKIILERLKATYGVDQDVLDRWRGLGLNAHEIDNVLRLAKARGLDPETIAGERLAGTSWESILERHAPAGTGGA